MACVIKLLKEWNISQSIILFIVTLQQGIACKIHKYVMFVHSTLYLKTCCYRIDGNGVIKVADFGLTEDMYGNNYFRRRKSVTGSDEKVPIRWMAPESIENDIYIQ